MMMKCICWLLWVLSSVVFCQLPKKSPVLPISEDLPFIKCDVCKKATKALYKTVQRKRIEEKLDEDGILSIVERFCDTDSDFGDWITKLDIIEETDALRLVEHPKEGKCDRECKTISRSCENTIGDIDTDLGELLWNNKIKLSAFINTVCHQLTDSCDIPQKKFKSGKRKDYKFVEMTEKDKKAKDVMKKMRGIPGMPGMEMYSQEDIAAMGEQYGMDPPHSHQDQEETQKDEPTTKLGFVDTLKASGEDMWKKMKGLFGYGSTAKQEL